MSLATSYDGKMESNMTKKGEQVWRDALDLKDEATRAKIKGSDEKALLLADQAISLLDTNNIDTYHWQIWRESLKNLGNKRFDYTSLIEFIKVAATTFQKEGDVVRAIDALMHLVSCLANAGNKREAQKYLDQLDKLLSQIQPDDLAKYMPQRFSATGLKSRQQHAQRLKQHVESLP